MITTTIILLLIGIVMHYLAFKMHQISENKGDEDGIETARCIGVVSLIFLLLSLGASYWYRRFEFT